MKLTLLFRIFCVVYFYSSMVIASIDGFNNMVNDFKITRKQKILYIFFPLTLVFELLMFIFYKTHKFITQK